MFRTQNTIYLYVYLVIHCLEHGVLPMYVFDVGIFDIYPHTAYKLAAFHPHQTVST